MKLDLKDSLKKLRTDYVDMYLVHLPFSIKVCIFILTKIVNDYDPVSFSDSDLCQQLGKAESECIVQS